jgi:hypothetical protein
VWDAVTAHIRLDSGAGQPTGQLHDLKHRAGLAAASVECFSRSAAVFKQVADSEVRVNGGVDVEGVSLRGAVGADHRTSALDCRQHRLGDEPGEIRSPPPYTFAKRVTATGRRKVCQYEREMTSVAAFDTSYG